MKKLLPLLLCLLMMQAAYPQQFNRAVMPRNLKDLCLKRTNPSHPLESINLQQSSNLTVKAGPLVPNETTIGVTRWDAQSYSSLENKIYLFPDGTIGATWIFGMTDAAFPDRGTGYNFFDGTSWGPQPTAKLEDQRTGFGAYAPWGEAGEVVLAHNAIDGLKMSQRPQKGSGIWTYSLLQGPTGHEKTYWPYIMTSGPTRNNLHILTITASTTYSGTPYLNQDGALVYSRSLDGGLTWNPKNVILPGMGYQDYNAIENETYPIAEPKGETIAFVVGDSWLDLFLMKSTDNGSTWTKTVIFQHPYPHFVESTTLVLDTPWVSDGSQAVALDNNGMAHVFFGLMRVLNDDTTNANTSFFPGTDGLAYWNESMPPLTNLNSDTLYAHGNLVGWCQDFNGNDTNDIIAIAGYQLSLSSMPSVTIDQDNKMFLLFTSVREDLDNGSQNYRHVFGRMSANFGETWTEMKDLTGGITHNFHECVFPYNSPTSNDNIHFMYQQDEEPGMAVWIDADPYGDNNIVYVKVPKEDFCEVHASFTTNTDTAMVGNTIAFTDASTGGAIAWSWDFGDGVTSTLQNPTHQYTAIGSYNVTLTASDGTCSTDFTKPVYITPNGLDENSNISMVSQNIPNPFSGSSVVSVTLTKSSDLNLEVYDMIGKSIYSQSLGKVAAGNHAFIMEAGNFRKGIYFYTVSAGNQSVTRKMAVN